jgi:hypothetical protein
MTNDPDEARDFWRRHQDGVIYEMFIALPKLGVRRDGCDRKRQPSPKQ